MDTAIRSAEILSVGTELLLGEIIDTNSSYLAADLASRGVDVYWSQRVGDNRKRIVHAVKQALERSDLLVMTGGLGPTDDDMTREAIAESLGETPTLDPKLEQDLRERFAKLSRSMPEKNLKQAWLIPSAQSLANPRGTAPGWLVTTRTNGKTRFIVTLPGPPRELTRMWELEALPRLPLATSALFTQSFKTFGWGESQIAEKLGALTLESNPSVATYAKRDGVHVRVAAKADTADNALLLAKEVVNKVETILEPVTWGQDQDEITALIGRALKTKGLTLATFETSSGGLLSHLLTSVSDAATAYRGGVVAYDMQAQAALDLNKGNDEASALVIAEAAAQRLNADIGLALYEDLTGSSENKTYFLAVAGSGFKASQKLVLNTSLPADWLRERASYAGLFLLWSQLRA
ncbi:MAG: CinA family nicotinamide mononucleotide deamidase-related protein [Trueperaceae bacterium]|nr:CinA family nicotinamide mononucleotide deamidase-related protein [Trueperaceae bacterium]